MELVVGRVVKAHGLTGELVVDVRTDDPEERFAPGTRLRLRHPRAEAGPEAVGREAVVESSRPHGARMLVRVVGVADRDAADALRGHVFLIDTAELPPIDDPDEFYDHQLEGLVVRTRDGREIGSVAEVLHTGGTDLLSVRNAEGREFLVPFVNAIVTSVSLSDGIVEIEPPEGLLELD